MIISHKHKFIFGGIGRSGSSSIHKALNSYNDDGSIGKHKPFKQLEGYLDNWKEYFKFCIIRNPWDLAVSKYFYHKGEKCKHRNGYGKILVCKNAREMPFIDWVKIRPHLYVEYETPIYNFKDFTSDSDNIVVADKMFNFDSINTVGKYMNENFNIDVEVPHVNKTKHDEYWKYYENDTEAIDVVYNHFYWGINLMGFRFGEKLSSC